MNSALDLELDFDWAIPALEFDLNYTIVVLPVRLWSSTPVSGLVQPLMSF